MARHRARARQQVANLNLSEPELALQEAIKQLAGVAV